MSGKRIVIVDDEPEALVTMSQSLQRAGYDVQTYQDGESVMEAVRKQMPDLLLCEVSLQKGNGYQVARTVSGLSTSVAILLMSERTHSADQYWAQNAGAIELLHKPVNPKRLLARVGEILS